MYCKNASMKLICGRESKYSYNNPLRSFQTSTQKRGRPGVDSTKHFWKKFTEKIKMVTYTFVNNGFVALESYSIQESGSKL
jgi:hypothetical protein